MANVGNITQQVIHLTQNMALMQANQNLPPPAPIPQSSPTFTPIPIFTTTISIHTGPGPYNTYALFFLHQRTKDRNSPPLFWKKGWHQIFHQWMLLIYEWPKIGIPWWGCQDLLDPFIHADWFCQNMAQLHCRINVQGTTIVLDKWWATKRNWPKVWWHGQENYTVAQNQEDRLADEHVQEFEKAALEASYEGYPLVVEFKYLLNSGLRRRLMELWPMPMTIQQWYDEAIMMDCQWKVAKTEEFFYEKVNGTVRKPLQHGQQGQGQGQGQASSSQQRYQWQFFRNQMSPQHGCYDKGLILCHNGKSYSICLFCSVVPPL